MLGFGPNICASFLSIVLVKFLFVLLSFNILLPLCLFLPFDCFDLISFLFFYLFGLRLFAVLAFLGQSGTDLQEYTTYNT